MLCLANVSRQKLAKNSTPRGRNRLDLSFPVHVDRTERGTLTLGSIKCVLGIYSALKINAAG